MNSWVQREMGTGIPDSWVLMEGGARVQTPESGERKSWVGVPLQVSEGGGGAGTLMPRSCEYRRLHKAELGKN